ncbi:MAG: hypothetical protein BWX51_01299 [Bacteroidetes bacterium ADurb.Bin012]|jgi:hypothetical protein|nr:MAG: hypothetical protein BWX51_01299 [Bacteroidetes bacterium ADurb.Bin012]
MIPHSFQYNNAVKSSITQNILKDYIDELSLD